MNLVLHAHTLKDATLSRPTLMTHGTQRLRKMAAMHLKILQPSQPLFNTNAPMRRQTQWLAEWPKMLAR